MVSKTSIVDKTTCRHFKSKQHAATNTETIPWGIGYHTMLIAILLVFGIQSTFAQNPTTQSITETASSHDNQTGVHQFYKFNVKCKSNEHCFIQFNSSQNVIEKAFQSTEPIFREYVENGTDYINVEGLEKLLKKYGFLKQKETDDHEGHDHESHEGHDHESHEGHDHESHEGDDHESHEDDDHESHEGHDSHESHEDPSYYDGIDYLFGLYYYDYNNEDTFKCLMSVDDVLYEFYPNVMHGDVKITLSDFALILPRLIMQYPKCHADSAEVDEDHKAEEMSVSIEERGKVWGIALVSVAIISLLSVIGIMIVPLMGRSMYFNRLLSFLVALAVGTLVGDALLHLLPHAMGGHEGDAHAHGGAEEKDKVLKNLVAVLGVYMFFVFESGMVMIRKRRRQQKLKTSSDSIPKLIQPSTKTDDFIMLPKPDTNDPLLAPPDGVVSNRVDDVIVKSMDSGISSTNNVSFKMPNGSDSTSPYHNSGIGGTPPFPLTLNLPDDDKEMGLKSCENSSTDLQSHDHHHHHHHVDIATVQGIKDLAWMIIVGDGLHNFSDGLAIGAAFSSSIAAGLSTSLAIFCHELPHELGDFAILIDAGVTVKRALLYNGLCACLAFIGVIIGMAIGEYTTSVKLWILAVTAGGFLYVGLVDMLPQMLQQCSENDGFRRFIFQNLGFISGVVIMLLIALYEESFGLLFNISHSH